MKKLLFYYSVAEGHSTIYIGTAHLYLKTYLDINKPESGKKLEWLIPQQTALSDQKLIDLCHSYDIDYLCTSHYIWNHSELLEQLARIRSQLRPNIKIIAGGPSISSNVDKDFFVKYPFFDYAVYGPGERAFSDLMESLVEGKKIVSAFTSNLSWEDDGKVHVAPYQYVKMLPVSPFLHNRDLFKQMILRERRAGKAVILPYDLVRGCPYSCTFCDWNSGLSNKVSRRKNTFEDEIDLFQELGIDIVYLSDANVGQYEEDILMIEYFAKKNLEEGTNFKLMGNFSKLRKENNLKIFHIMAKGKLLNQGFTISCQDTHKEILDNIDRPDISWEEHAKMIDELTTCHPNIPCQVQLIQGLPGQTVQTWRTSLGLVAKHQTVLMTFLNEILPASPAANDPKYQERFKFVYSQSRRYMGGDLSKDQKFYRGNFSKSCVSFSSDDFVAMTILSHFYTMICGMKFKLKQFHNKWSVENIVDKFLESEFYFRLYENLKENWNNDNFYYTINIDGAKFLISACTGYSAAYIWMKSPLIQKFVANCIDDEELKLAILSYKWQKISYYDNYV